MKLRHDFPPYGSTALGGTSDGVLYTTCFAGTTLEATLGMVRVFLDEEGYEDVPIPATTEEMLAFLQPEEGAHPHLFARPAYAHNPVRLVLPARDRLRRKISVELYNEHVPGHLLRFHRRACADAERRLRAAIEARHFERYGPFIPVVAPAASAERTAPPEYSLDR